MNQEIRHPTHYAFFDLPQFIFIDIHILGEVIRLPKGASVPVTLKVLEYELFHFCPIKVRLNY